MRIALLAMMVAWPCLWVEAAQPQTLLLSDGWRFRPAPEPDERLIGDAPADLAIAADPGADWPRISVPGGWFAQGFNPSRAGWYRCEVELPEAWKAPALALELTARCRGEIVYANGVPVGARRKPGGPPDAADGDATVYLIPRRLLRQRTLSLAIRLDAPGVRRPGLGAPPRLRPATAAELMTPARTTDGLLLHRPDGLDSFPNDPITVGDLLINVSSRWGGAYVIGGTGARMKVVITSTRQTDEHKDATIALGMNYSIIDYLTGDEVVGGGFIIDVPAGSSERVIDLYAARPGSFTARFLFSAEGVTRALHVPYSVFPQPPVGRPQSPFGLMLSAHPEITRLCGARWIMRPGLLTTDFTWGGVKSVTDQVARRMQANAEAVQYGLVSESVEPRHIRLMAPPSPDDPRALGRLRKSYLTRKASKRGLLQLTIPPGKREAFEPLLARGAANYCDVLCVGWRMPPIAEPEAFVVEKVGEVRSIAAECDVPPAPAILLAAPDPVSPETVVRTFLTALATGAWKVFWDAGGPGDTGWMRPDGSAAPPMPALACLFGLLGEARFLGRVDVGAPVYAFAFHSGTEHVLAVWKNGAPAVVALPAADRVLTMMGQLIVANGGAVTDVMVSETPIYLCGIADEDLAELAPPDWTLPSLEGLIGRLEKIGQVAPARAIAVRTLMGVLTCGDNDVAVELANWSARKVQAAAALQCPDGWAVDPEQQAFALEPLNGGAGRVALRFSVRIPPTAPPGEYAVPLLVTVGGNTSALEALRLNVTTPVGDLSNIHLAEVYSSAPSMAVPVSNPFGERVEARVGLLINDWTITPAYVPVDLAPGEEKLLRFIVSGPLPVVGPLQVGVTILQEDGALTVQRTADISRQRADGLVIGRPEVQALRFDGRRLSYRLSKMALVSVRVYDPQGRLIRTLDSGWQSAGLHEYTWAPEHEPDELGRRISYLAEVRAGLDVLFERRIAAREDTVFAPRSVAVDATGAAYVFEGPRAMKFTRRGRYSGCDLPGTQFSDLAGIKPLADGTYVALRRNRLLLLDARGRLLKAIPPAPRDDGDIAAGHFRKPASLAVSRDGLIYVTDSGNHRVERFDSQLELSPFPAGRGNSLGKLDSFGCPVAGAEDGEFTSPTHIAVGPQGRVAVFDAGGRVQIFDASGRHVRTIATALEEIACLAIESDAVFIALPGAEQITKLITGAGQFAPVEKFGAAGSVTVESPGISAIEPDGHGRLLVCSGEAVSIINALSGEPLGRLGRKPPANAIASPAGIDVDDNGSIFVTDLASHCVVRLAPGGDLPGLRMPTSLFNPIDVAVDASGCMYVLDDSSAGRRLVMLDPRGQPKFAFKGSYFLDTEEIKKAATVEVTDHGSVWAGDGERGTLFERGGNLLARNALRPHSKAEAGGVLYAPWQEGAARGLVLKDVTGREIVRKGALGTEDGRFADCMPGGIAARVTGPGKPDYVYYADVFNHRITVLRVEWSTISQATGER